MTEHQQKTLNAFGEALLDLMTEKGIDAVPELVERMRQHPSYREQFTEDYITNLMTMTDADEWPEDDVDLVLFHVLKHEEVLNLSNEEVRTNFLEPFYRVAGPILDQCHQRTLTEREEWIEHLADDSPGAPGVSREDAELRMVDDDLWMLFPECRYEFPVGEQSVRQWRDAVDALEGLSIAFENLGNDALQHAIGDAHVRASEALRRHRQRAQEASAQ